MPHKIPPVVRTLRAVRKLLSKPERWTKHANARRADGEPTALHARQATCWCLGGAVGKCGTSGDSAWNAMKALVKAQRLSQPMRLSIWNDAPRRTHADVLALLDRTIERELRSA